MIFGGRMYGPWIDYSSEVRKRIRINGGLTTELDRKASHLNAMYQVITGKPCSYDDAYDLTLGGIKVPRHIVKNFCSFMQGSSSESAGYLKDERKQSIEAISTIVRTYYAYITIYYETADFWKSVQTFV